MWRFLSRFLLVVLATASILFAVEHPLVYPAVPKHKPTVLGASTGQLVATKGKCLVDATHASDLANLTSQLAIFCNQTYPAVTALLHSVNQPLVRIYFYDTIDNSFEESGNIYLQADHYRVLPGDKGELVHELAHTTQDYPQTPHWLKESLADYVQFKLGYASAVERPDCHGSNYLLGYGCGAALINFIEHKYDASIVHELDQQLQVAAYDQTFFVTHTGHSLDQLYNQCLSSDCRGGHKL
jgi:Peptidase of plants and bacteria